MNNPPMHHDSGSAAALHLRTSLLAVPAWLGGCAGPGPLVPPHGVHWLLLGLLVVALFGVWRWWRHGGADQVRHRRSRDWADRMTGYFKSRPSALEVLDDRYARGEIDFDEYLQRYADLTRHDRR